MTSKQKADDRVLRLPKDSYTAYRLRYGDAQELYLTSRVVFLGKVPNVWLLDKKSVLLAEIHKLRTLTKTKNMMAEKLTMKNFESILHTEQTPHVLNPHQLHQQTGSYCDVEQNVSKLDEKDTHNPTKKMGVSGITSLFLHAKCEHCAEQTDTSAVAVVTGDNVYTQKLSNISDEFLGKPHTTFKAPRTSIQQENIEFCKSFVPHDESAHFTKGSGETSDRKQFLSATYLNRSKSLNNQSKESVATSRMDNFSLGLLSGVNNKPNESLERFLNRSLDERQNILETEINDVMIFLNQKNKYETTPMNDSGSEDTYFTATDKLTCDYPASEESSIHLSQIEKKPAGKVTFLAQNSLHQKPSFSTHYSLSSVHRKVSLEEQTPIPASLNDQFMHHFEGFNEQPCVTESALDIDDNAVKTYKLFKSKTLASKYASTLETTVEERKKKLSAILKRFKKGEIIKMEKMLVMISCTDKIGVDVQFSNKTKNSEKWKEYIVVVRATSDLGYPAIIQFYKTNQILKKDSLFNLKNALFEEQLELEISKSKYEMEREELKDVFEQEVPAISDAECENDHSLPSHGNPTSVKAEHSNKEVIESLKQVRYSEKKKLQKLRQKKVNEKKQRFKDQKEQLELLRKHATGTSPTFAVVISKYDTEISFANLLDKSIQINKIKGTKVLSHLLLAHSTTSAITWISFLRQLLNPRDTKLASNNFLMINIPAIDVSFNLIREKALLDAVMDEKEQNNNFSSVIYHEKGYRFKLLRSFEYVLNALKLKLQVLEKSNVLSTDTKTREFLRRLKTKEARLALAFKKYDRLEWILGESPSLVQMLWNCIGSSYELELREYKHDSHNLFQKIFEPSPVEGFVIKLSDRMGKLKSPLGKDYFKLFYAFTSNNILFFQNFYRAVPAFPISGESLLPHTFISAAGEVRNMKSLERAAKHDTSTFLTTPYPMDNDHVSWLKPDTTLDQYINRDAYALYEAERRSGLVSSAHSMIDLTKVQEVRKSPRDKVSPLLKTSGNLIWGASSKESIGDDGDFQQNCFELVMFDKTIVQLNVSSRIIRDEWINRLREISQYWSLKESQELKKRAELREKNLALLNTEDDHYQSIVAAQLINLSSKQELSKAKSDSEVYSISSYVLDKPILNSGYLYCRSLSGKQFKRFYAVLSPGFIVLYKVYNRSKTTKVAKPSAYYKKVKTIPLSTCYVFSEIGKADSAYKSTLSFGSELDFNGLPRVYEDGWKSSESPTQRLFSIWVGTKKILIKDKKSKGQKYLNGKSPLEALSENDSDGNDAESIKSKMKSKFKNGGFLRKIRPHSIGNTMYVEERNQSEDFEESEDLTDNFSDDEDETHEGSDCENLDSYFKRFIGEADRVSPIDMLKTVSKLGVSGEGFTFLARSRMDRDIWVTRLMTEIERFSAIRNNDISLI